MITTLKVELEDPGGRQRVRRFGPILVDESYRGFVLTVLVRKIDPRESDEAILRIAESYPDRLVFLFEWEPSPEVLAVLKARNVAVGADLEARGEVLPHQRPELS